MESIARALDEGPVLPVTHCTTLYVPSLSGSVSPAVKWANGMDLAGDL